jgi:hypothetical protein
MVTTTRWSLVPDDDGPADGDDDAAAVGDEAAVAAVARTMLGTCRSLPLLLHGTVVTMLLAVAFVLRCTEDKGWRVSLRLIMVRTVTVSEMLGEVGSSQSLA